MRVRYASWPTAPEVGTTVNGAVLTPRAAQYASSGMDRSPACQKLSTLEAVLNSPPVRSFHPPEAKLVNSLSSTVGRISTLLEKPVRSAPAR